MDKRNLLHPDNMHFIRPLGDAGMLNGRPTARDGYPVFPRATAVVDVEWLREVCEKAGREFRDEWVATTDYCPVTHASHVYPDERPGTTDSDLNVHALFYNCKMCRYPKPPFQNSSGAPWPA